MGAARTGLRAVHKGPTLGIGLPLLDVQLPPPPHVQGGKARGGWLLKFPTPLLPGGWRGETRLNGTLKLCTADQLLL